MIKLEIYYALNGLNEMNTYIKGGAVRESFNSFVNNLSWSFKNGYIREKNGSDYYYKNAIYYENKKFIIIYNGMKYYLDLDEETINNYEKGEYNAITHDLKELIDLFNEELRKEEIKERRNKVIDDAEKGIFPDTESKIIYKEYLMECINEARKEMIEKFKVIGGIYLILTPILHFLSMNIALLILKIIELTAVAITVLYLIFIIKSNKQYSKECTDIIEDITNSINQEQSTSKKKELSVSKAKVTENINYVTDRLKNIDNKDKILILEKLRKVLELYSKNEDKINDSIMLRLNVIKQNLNYFETREKNAYIADKPKRKVLKPNINSVSKKKFTRG